MRDLPREQRLRGRDRIGEIFREGARAAAGTIAARALPNGGGTTRLAAVAGKALGGAVKRNRMRRLIRAAFRQNKADLPGGWDLVLLARQGLLEAKWEDVCRDVTTAMRRVAGQATGPRRLPPRP